MSRWALLAGVCVAAVVLPSCGKKGPPLPPIVHAPDAVRQVAARRIGDEVFLSMTLPAQNVDTSIPVDLGRVDVYGYTGSTAPPPPRFAEVATLVGTIAGAKAGVSTTLRDELTRDELVAGRPLTRTQGSSGPAPAAVDAGPLRRFYMIVAFSDRGRPGPPSAVIELPLTVTPDAPLDVQATYSAQAATLRWEPSGGLVGFLLDLAPPPTAAPLDDGAVATAGRLPVGPTRYNIYREIEPPPASVPAADATAAPAVAPPQPINKQPLDGLTYSDPLQIDGRRRCYTVTAVRGAAERAVESRQSGAACITPVDTFAPARPTGVSPIAVEGAISLVWEANTEPDVRGYVVLRGAPGDERLMPVTEQAIAETRFTDRNVSPGERYVYAVTAVDSRSPQPNASAESERVEITAR